MSVKLVGVLTVKCELLSNMWCQSVLVNVMTPDYAAILVNHHHCKGIVAENVHAKKLN